jgi:hypothetical protein
VGPVGFEASVRIPFLVDFMVHYTSSYKIILAAMLGDSINKLKVATVRQKDETGTLNFERAGFRLNDRKNLVP